ncbi:endonuclease-8 [Actinobaculum suis]|uniref:DNA-(apurinic or apyrimidinic site) lyase n=1 Tax=Actinobaculum suis TaxID=1657 RepID=A0A1G7CQH5_9ACTO|nr:zinc finger domain-containing protein [Actinobaculum suis]MDY5152502.1 zinc finger domain-containing protein [Actinobaculum suis]SDE40906.1 endonuclease-8 [Actinobaculum suis]VDG75595.1 DNA-(apurinic or apyrimidinic site) lyase [Actinobaculum suis]
MPEGHSIHRHARILTTLFGGRPVHTSSPQGRFAAGAQILDGRIPGRAQAWGKHLFWPFFSAADVPALPADAPISPADAPAPPVAATDTNSAVSVPTNSAFAESAGTAFAESANAVVAAHPHAAENSSAENAPAENAELVIPEAELGEEGPVWLQIHLGLYGKWAFAGAGVADLGGAGIQISPTEDSGMMAAMRQATDGGKDMTTSLQFPEDNIEVTAALAPRPTTRLRIVGAAAVAQLTGPAQCNILTGAEVQEKLATLGPDPIRNQPGDRERFVEGVRRRRIPAGQAVMDQSLVAGPGNIYRADCLWHIGISPHRPANKVSVQRWEKLWDDLCFYMSKDVATGIIITIPPEYQPDPIPADDPELSRFVAYHRTGRPCVRCGATIAEEKMAGRRLFWCPGCQH